MRADQTRFATESPISVRLRPMFFQADITLLQHESERVENSNVKCAMAIGTRTRVNSNTIEHRIFTRQTNTINNNVGLQRCYRLPAHDRLNIEQLQWEKGAI